MRVSTLVFTFMLGILAQFHAANNAIAQGSQNFPSTISSSEQALLQQLTTAKLKQTAVLIEQLSSNENIALLPLYQTLLDGQLYYVKASGRLLKSNKNSSGERTNYDVFSDEQVVGLDKKAIKKIRVNNSLRKQLRALIAKATLLSTNDELRLASLTAMLSDINSDNIGLIKKLKDKEKNHDIIELLDIAMAIYTLNTAIDETKLIAAINTLSGSVQPAARNQLVAARDNQQPQYNQVVHEAAATALQSIDKKIELYAFIEKLFFGLSLGSVLLLAAIGLAITFGVMGVINMAHGEMIMLGAYTTYVIQLLMPNFIEYSLWFAIPAAFLVSASVGVLIQKTVIRHLHGRPLETLLATFGISLILQQTVRTIFSPLNRQVISPEWMSGSLAINPVFSLTYNRLYIIAFALLVFLALLFILKKTNLGLHVRAVSQNRNMAKSMGIKTERVDAMTFGLGSGVAGVAGVALSQLTNVGPNLGQAYIIDSFMVVVFGGVGNLLGTLIAAFSLGITNKFLEPLTGAVLANILVLVFIILFIQKRPKGLFPQKGRAAE
jgi:urea transport system permease protein